MALPGGEDQDLPGGFCRLHEDRAVAESLPCPQEAVVVDGPGQDAQLREVAQRAGIDGLEALGQSGLTHLVSAVQQSKSRLLKRLNTDGDV